MGKTAFYDKTPTCLSFKGNFVINLSTLKMLGEKKYKVTSTIVKKTQGQILITGQIACNHIT